MAVVAAVVADTGAWDLDRRVATHDLALGHWTSAAVRMPQREWEMWSPGSTLVLLGSESFWYRSGGRARGGARLQVMVLGPGPGGQVEVASVAGRPFRDAAGPGSGDLKLAR